MSTSRVMYLDILRILATFAVIMLHVASQYTYLDVHSTGYAIGITSNGFCRWCVPIFVMISGALFLQPDKCIDLKLLYKKYILRLAVVFIAWWGLYVFIFDPLCLICQQIYTHQPIAYTLGSIGEYAYHLWFLPMLIGVYVLIPILRAVVNAHLEKYYIILWLLVSCIMFLKPFATTLHLYPFYRVMEEMKIGVLYGYSGYFILGYYLSNIRITKTYSILAWVGFIGSWLLIAYGTYLLGNFKLYDYLTPLVIIMSVAFFVIIRYRFENNNNNALNNCISWVRKDLLGVYLIHVFYLNLIPTFWFIMEKSEGYMNGWMAIIQIPVYSIAIMLMSLFTIRLLRKIPYVSYICS